MNKKLIVSAGAIGMFGLIGSIAFAASQVTLQSSSISSSPVNIGTSTALTIVLAGADQNQTVLVDMELYDSGNHKVAQTFLDNQTIQANTTRTYRMTTPTNL